MSTKTYFINSTQAAYTDEEFAWMQSLFLEEGLIGDAAGAIGFATTQLATPGMGVQVAAGKALVEIVKSGRTFKVVVESDAVAALVVAQNTSGSNRVDAVIIRVDVDTEPNVTKSNVGTIEVITGTGATALSNAAIDTAVGGDGWIRIANITVANGAVSILNASIADTRTRVTFKDALGISGLLTPLIGAVFPFAGSVAPTGFLDCDGSAVSRSTYAALFAVIGTTYGAGDGSTTFNLPDIRGATIVGAGTGVGSISFANTAIDTATDIITVPSNIKLLTGKSVLFTGTGTMPTIAARPTRSFNIDNLGWITWDDTLMTDVIGNGDRFNVLTQTSTNLLIQNYYIVNFDLANKRFQVSSTLGGAAEATGNSGTGTGAVTPTIYSGTTTLYVIRLSATTIKFAASRVGASTGVALDFATQGTGTNTLSWTRSARTLGDAGGEEAHTLTPDENAYHVHSVPYSTSGAGSGAPAGDDSINIFENTLASGLSQEHNNMSPFVVLKYLIRAY